MLTTASPFLYKTSHEITQSAIEDLEYATFVLSHERVFERLSYEQFLSIIASHEVLVFGYLQELKNHSVPDGLALSFLAEKSEKVAQFVIRSPQLRILLQGLDIARIGQASPLVAMEILHDEELRAKLKSAHLAMLAEDQPKTAEYIASHPALFTIDPNDLGKLCKSNPVLAKQYLTNKELVKKCEGSTLALMVEMHPKLIEALITDTELNEKLDSQALVILGRANKDVAFRFFNSEEYRRRLGPFALARMLKNHPELAMLALNDNALCAQFNGACFAQLAQCEDAVAFRVFAEHRKALSIDDCVMIAKNYSSLALQLLKDPFICPLISGKNLVILGTHPDVCDFILQDKTLREAALKFNVGLMGLRSISHANRMLTEKDLKENLQQLDLANLCKNYLFVTQLTLNSAFLQSKISSSYHELIQQRMKTVISLSSFVQSNFSQKPIQSDDMILLENPSPYPFPLMSTTTPSTMFTSVPLPVPEAESKFSKTYQSVFC